MNNLHVVDGVDEYRDAWYHSEFATEMTREEKAKKIFELLNEKKPDLLSEISNDDYIYYGNIETLFMQYNALMPLIINFGNKDEFEIIFGYNDYVKVGWADNSFKSKSIEIIGQKHLIDALQDAVLYYLDPKLFENN